MSPAEERWEAACFSMGLAGLYHLRPQTLQIAECSAFEKPQFQPSQAAILSSVPLMLCWSRLEELFLSRKFNIVRAFEQSEGQGSGRSLEGVLGGEKGIDEESVVGFSLDSRRIYLLFSSPDRARNWKRAANRLLKAYFHPQEPVSPRSSLSLRPCLGLLFDITPSDSPPGLKLTFLRPSGAYEEFCAFEKDQHPAVGRETALAALRPRVDAGSWAVLRLFAEEETELERAGKQGREGRDWLLKLMDVDPSRINPRSLKFQGQRSLSALQTAVSQQRAGLPQSASPVSYLFALLSLHCTSLELALSSLNPSKPVTSQSMSPRRNRLFPAPTNFSRPHQPSKPLRRPGKWYRDACDCHIY